MYAEQVPDLIAAESEERARENAAAVATNASTTDAQEELTAAQQLANLRQKLERLEAKSDSQQMYITELEAKSNSQPRHITELEEKSSRMQLAAYGQTQYTDGCSCTQPCECKCCTAARICVKTAAASCSANLEQLGPIQTHILQGSMAILQGGI